MLKQKFKVKEKMNSRITKIKNNIHLIFFKVAAAPAALYAVAAAALLSSQVPISALAPLILCQIAAAALLFK